MAASRHHRESMRPELLKLAARFAEREERFAIVTVVRREPPSFARLPTKPPDFVLRAIR